jgi:hypothetical protein
MNNNKEALNMNKLLLLAAVAALTMNVALWGQTITVTSPAAGNEWCLGSTQTITWTKSGAMQATAGIRLRAEGSAPGAEPALYIVDGTANDGSYSWMIPNTVAPGNYFIRVKTEDGTVVGDSANFKIKSCAPLMDRPPKTILDIEQVGTHCMAITSPKAGDTATLYNTVYVKWTKRGTLDANVSVALLRKGKGVFPGGVTLAASTPNSGIFTWDPKSLAPNPGIYVIIVKTLDGKCDAVSEEFTMMETGGIELLTPKGGEVWESGTSHAVTWKRLGNIQTLDILLNRAGSWTKTLVQGVDAKLGTKSVAFVRGDTDGANQVCYKVFINHSGGNAANPSGCITLTGNPDLAVSASFYPGMANIGTDLTFTIKVENKGMVRSQACQGDFKVNGAIHKTFSVPAIDPGATATVTVTWKLACPGKVTISVDPGGANVEADKANNVWEKPIC